MTKNLEELFDLLPKDEMQEMVNTLEKTAENLDDKNLQERVQKFSIFVSMFDDPEFDKEMDDMAEETIKFARDLMSLSEGVETKYVGEIASAAERFYTAGINAKKIKAERKLKAIQLELRNKQLELREKQLKINDPDEIYNTDGSVYDRNELL